MKTVVSGFLIFSMLMLFTSCNNSEEQKLVGEWRNLSIDVTMRTADGSDSSRVFSADQQNWVEKLGIQPIRTFYHRDGSYVSRYFSPNDSLLREHSGRWEIKDDSLYLYQTNPDSITYKSKFSVQNDTARFEMMLDWDQDGVRDDHYVGLQKKYSDKLKE